MKTTIELDSKLIMLKAENNDIIYYLHVKNKNGIDASYRIGENDWIYKWLRAIDI